MVPTIREVVDLSHELYSGMPNIGGLPITFWPVNTYEDQRKISGGKVSYESRMMLMAEHCGTHLDAPRHFDENGLSLHEVSLERLVLPGHLLDLRHRGPGEAITPDDLLAAAKRLAARSVPGRPFVCGPDRIKNWGKGDLITTRPFVPTSTAQWLRTRHHTVCYRSDRHGRPRRMVVAHPCNLAQGQRLHGAATRQSGTFGGQGFSIRLPPA